jgi:hypothetical protein
LLAPLLAVPGPVRAAEDGKGEVLVATIHSVDLASSRLSLLTGRGHAFRIVTVLLPPASEITRTGRVVPLSELKRGVVVRVQFATGTVEGMRKAAQVELQGSGR